MQDYYIFLTNDLLDQSNFVKINNYFLFNRQVRIVTEIKRYSIDATAALKPRR